MAFVEAKARILWAKEFGAETLGAVAFVKTRQDTDPPDTFGDEEIWFTLAEQSNLSVLFSTLSQRAEQWEATGGQSLWKGDSGNINLHFDIT